MRASKLRSGRTSSILSESADEGAHLSAEDVYQRLRDAGDDVGLATVYRVLTQFETAGLVERHNFESGHSVLSWRAMTIRPYG